MRYCFSKLTQTFENDPNHNILKNNKYSLHETTWTCELKLLGNTERERTDIVISSAVCSQELVQENIVFTFSKEGTKTKL